MLADLCKELKNWFEREKYIGEFTIADGAISMPDDALQVGQYFRIVGSVFNDGVYVWPADGLTDETFEGAVWAMAVPPAVIALSESIDAWRELYESPDSAAMSPYNSESFGGYSYSKGGGANRSGGSSSAATWRSVFADVLNNWRKI